MEIEVILWLVAVALVATLAFVQWKKHQKKEEHIKYMFKESTTENSKQLLKELNMIRDNNNVRVLLQDEFLTSLAERRIDEIKLDFSHKGVQDEFSLALEAGMDKVGENLAKGFYTASGVINAFFKSQKHRENMLNPIYQYVGIAVKDGYYCVLFGFDKDFGI